MRDHAEKRRRPAHGQLVLLGQHDRRQLHGQMGEQVHVLHCERIRFVDLKKSAHTLKHKYTHTQPPVSFLLFLREMINK
jgi:hypothetical protein